MCYKFKLHLKLSLICSTSYFEAKLNMLLIKYQCIYKLCKLILLQNLNENILMLLLLNFQHKHIFINLVIYSSSSKRFKTFIIS